MGLDGDLHKLMGLTILPRCWVGDRTLACAGKAGSSASHQSRIWVSSEGASEVSFERSQDLLWKRGVEVSGMISAL
jgi:hypothetical protein